MIPISPLDYWLFVFEWKGKLYVDIFLPFGLRTSPFIFNLFSEGLHWILEWLFDRQLVHYLDDFLLIDDPDPEFFSQISSYLGLFEKTSKREDGWVVNFLGIELNSDTMEARLPHDKRERPLVGVQKLLVKGSVSHHLSRKYSVSFHSVLVLSLSAAHFFATCSISFISFHSSTLKHFSDFLPPPDGISSGGPLSSLTGR